MRSEVDGYKRLLITFAMPFFYVMTSYFAINLFVKIKDVKNVLVRFKSFWVVISVYTLVYELPKIVFKLMDSDFSYRPFNIDTTSLAHAISSLLYTLKSVNNSPVYYVFQVFVIYCLAAGVVYVKQLLRNDKAFVVLNIIFLTVMVRYYHDNLQYFIGKDALIIFFLATIYYFLTAGLSWKKFHLSLSQVILLLVVSVISLGALSYLINPAYVSVIFLLIKDSFTVDENSHSLSKLSIWGQRYSFGVFAWHYFFLLILDYFLPKVWIMFGFLNPSIILYVLINLLGFSLAFAFTVSIYRIGRLKQIFLLN
jgi:hypothetical protein